MLFRSTDALRGAARQGRCRNTHGCVPVARQGAGHLVQSQIGCQAKGRSFSMRLMHGQILQERATHESRIGRHQSNLPARWPDSDLCEILSVDRDPALARLQVPRNQAQQG